MRKNKREHSIIYKTAYIFALMSIMVVGVLSIVSYFFFSYQYTKTIKISLIKQYAILQTETEKNKNNPEIYERISALTDEGFLLFSREDNNPFYYHREYIPFTKQGFYKAGENNGKVLFYMDTMQGNNIFLGEKMDKFQKIESEYISILIAINIIFFIILMLLSFILSKSTLKHIRKLGEYLLGYKFASDNSENLYQDGQLFEIGLLTKSFDAAIHYVQQSLMKKKEFLQDASHELRTPLMGISSSIELLKITKLTQEQQKKIDIIQILTNKLQRITDELLFLTRGKNNLPPYKNIELAKEIRTIIMGHEEEIKRKDIRLITVLDDNYVIIAPEIHIQKLFSNLVDNAIKYTPKGGTIDIILQNDIFSIHDTGIGMSKTFLSKFGKRFIREEEATKINYEGIGLGLSIVYKIIQELKRKIDIQSEPGKGTRIKISFKE